MNFARGKERKFRIHKEMAAMARLIHIHLLFHLQLMDFENAGGKASPRVQVESYRQ